MNYDKIIIIPLCIIIGVVSMACIALSLTISEPLANLAEAQYLDAQAEANIARAQLAEAQAEKIHAGGEAAIFEAAAASVRKDSRLVAWYAVRGDVYRLLMACSAICGVTIGAMLGLMLGQQKRHIGVAK